MVGRGIASHRSAAIRLIDGDESMDVTSSARFCSSACSADLDDSILAHERAAGATPRHGGGGGGVRGWWCVGGFAASDERVDESVRRCDSAEASGEAECRVRPRAFVRA